MASPGLDPEYTFLFLKQLKSHPNLLHRLKCLDDFSAPDCWLSRPARRAVPMNQSTRTRRRIQIIGYN